MSAKFGIITRSLSTSSAVHQLVKPPLQIFGLEGRYACALYSAATKNKCLEAVEKDLISFQASVKKDVKLFDFIMDPTIKRSLKSSALKDASKTVAFNECTGNLLGVMADNGRLKKLNKVIDSFRLIMAAHRGEVVCEVITAKPLDAAQRTQLEGSIKKLIKPNETVLLTAKVDPSLIGGMIVSIADKYVDMSVASKIKKMSDVISFPV